ncbi:MAG: ABC transporter ATP-binding protein [Candidatus Gracilibacteria bacterium]|nr:ABC transporter ATP-binding protein [Candidatus Gracilibacteria bacterium]
MTAFQAIKRFFEPIFREPGYFYRMVGVNIFFASYSILSVLFIREITHILEVKNLEVLPKYIVLYGVFNIVFFISTYFVRQWGWAESAHHLLKMIHRDYMKRFDGLDNTYTENIGTGKIISIAAKGSEVWMGLIIDSISSITRLVIAIAGAIIILSNAGWMAVGIFFALFIIVHIGVHFLNSRSSEWRKKRVDTMNEYDRQIVKMIMSKFEILQNNRIGREIEVLDRHTDEAKIYNLRANDYHVAMFSLPSFVFFIITISILIATLHIPLSFASLVSMFMITAVLKETMVDSIDFFKNFTKQIYTVQKMWLLFDDAPKLTGLHEGEAFLFKKGEIEIRNLSFDYRGNHVFRDFSLSITGGQKTALVGLSGSGKSTLVKLIAGYLHPATGEVVVDGQSLNEVKLRDYYSHIGYLTQDPSVFDGTILENLTYGARSEVSETELRKAIELAQCEFIYEFQDGLGTEIGEKGVRLSGGQRQRLAIAKIFIKNPEIIILDEPTSALDSFSEEKINIAFHNLFSGRTVIVIAHRLQTVKEADDIIVLEHGTIVERGNHSELVERNGIYAKMLELQSGF